MNSADRSLLRALRNWTREGWPHSSIEPLRNLRRAIRRGDEREVWTIGESFAIELGESFATYCACGAIIHEDEGTTLENGDAACDQCAAKLTRMQL